MLSLIKMILNRKKIARLNAEWHEYNRECNEYLKLMRAANRMGEFYIAKRRYAAAHMMFNRSKTRAKYVHVLVDRMNRNLDESWSLWNA